MFLSYLKFLYQSKNQYSVHSPFVYQFLTKGLYPKINKTNFKPFLELRKQLLKNNKKIISQLVKKENIRPKKAKILFKIIQYLQPITILELGTCIGIATAAMQLASKTAKITTVESYKNMGKIAQENFDLLNFKNIKLYHSAFDKFSNNLSENTFFDAIYINEKRTCSTTLDYFTVLINHISNDSFMILEDIHCNQDTENTWNEIKNHKKVTVSIDLFYFGLVFFRKEQEKQHFVLRS